MWMSLACTYGGEQVGAWRSHNLSKSDVFCPWNSPSVFKGCVTGVTFLGQPLGTLLEMLGPFHDGSYVTPVTAVLRTGDPE